MIRCVKMQYFLKVLIRASLVTCWQPFSSHENTALIFIEDSNLQSCLSGLPFITSMHWFSGRWKGIKRKLSRNLNTNRNVQSQKPFTCRKTAYKWNGYDYISCKCWLMVISYQKELEFIVHVKWEAVLSFSFWKVIPVFLVILVKHGYRYI